MNPTLKVALIAVAVYAIMKTLDRLFLNEHVWSKFGTAGFESEEYED